MKDWQPDPARRPMLHGAADSGFDAATLLTCLATGKLHTAGHGEPYAGRPATRVLETDRHFLKIHVRPLSDAENAARFIETQRSLEARLDVHPQHKIWFALPVLDDQNEPAWLVGNRTPTLQMLDAGTPEIRHLQAALDRYFYVAAEHGKALDLSLSNFGVDAKDRVWYVDDDVYDWRDDHALHDFLAHLLRRGCLRADAAGILAARIRSALAGANRLAALDDLQQALKDTIVPPRQQAVLQRFLAALGERPVVLSREDAPAAEEPAPKSAKPIALLADVHGNLPALESVLAFLDETSVEQILLLGDVVGYGPHPRECIERLRERDDIRVIRGNHDNAVVTGEISGGTTSLANWSWQWSRTRLDADALAWLAALPCFHAQDDWLAVHGAPVDAAYFNAYVYRMSYEDNLDNLQQRGIRLCFHGHTHIQQLYCRHKGRDEAWEATAGNLSDVAHALLSPGSVGQPRCGKPGAELAIIDMASREYRFHRLEYDIEHTLHDMRRFDFPAGLIERLQVGQ